MSLQITEATYIPQADSIRVLFLQDNSLVTKYISLSSLSLDSTTKVAEILAEVQQIIEGES